MSIRTKILYITGMVLGALLAAHLFAFVVLAYSSIRNTETHNARENLARVTEALAAKSTELHALARDWAAWDETYAFVKDGHQEYITANCTAAAFRELNINTLLIMQPSGRIVYGAGFDEAAGTLTPVSPALLARVTLESPVLRGAAAGKATRATFMLENHPMLVTATPILTSRYQGPSRGTLLMGRALDTDELEAIGRQTRTNLTMYPLTNPSQPREIRQVLRHLSPTRRTVIHPTSWRLLYGDTVYYDLDGKPAFLLRTQLPRPLLTRGITGIILAAISLFIVGLVICLLLFRLLDKFVVSPLTRLSREVAAVGNSGNFQTRLAIEGRDEFASLASSTNALLRRLEAARQQDLRNQEALLEREVRVKTLFHAVQAPIVLIDEETHEIVEANPAAVELYGVTVDALLGQSCHDTICPKSAEECPFKPSDYTIENREAIFRTAARHEISILKSITRIYRDKRPYLLESFIDITVRKHAEQRLDYLAHHDTLTGLPNRLLFHDRLAQAVAQAHRRQELVALMLLDLDRFKEVNDILGHDVGDLLLQAVADRLRHLLREGDSICRLGGDEFVIVLPAVGDRQSAETVVCRCLECFNQPFIAGTHELFITASLGISLYPQDGENLDTLLKNADLAMYRVKALGKNTFQFFNDQMSAAVAAKVVLEQELRRALDQQEFVVHYQPQFNLQDGSVCGAEALVRWQHPERGLLFPDEFIAVADEVGLLPHLDAWVLRAACAQSMAWRQAGGAPVPMAVNISPQQLRNPELVAQIRAVLAETGLPAGDLELEISENTALQEIEQCADTLHALHALGVRLAIDDFGTGHASYGHLHQYPVQTLKIDAPFIRTLPDDVNSMAIVSSIITLCHALDITVVAEAVETLEQLAQLQAFCCDSAQGFLLGNPVLPERFFTEAAPATPLLRRSRDTLLER